MDFTDISAPEPCSRLARTSPTVFDDEFQRDSSEEISARLQDRLRGMQELVCYLLRKNEELRIEIFTCHERLFESQSSAILSELDHPSFRTQADEPRSARTELRASAAVLNEPL